MEEAEFLDVLTKAILMLPEHISVQRISAGISDESLVSPEWCRIKHLQMKNAREKLSANLLNY
jgi:hypothetical protein